MIITLLKHTGKCFNHDIHFFEAFCLILGQDKSLELRAQEKEQLIAKRRAVIG